MAEVLLALAITSFLASISRYLARNDLPNHEKKQPSSYMVKTASVPNRNYFARMRVVSISDGVDMLMTGDPLPSWDGAEVCDRVVRGRKCPDQSKTVSCASAVRAAVPTLGRAEYYCLVDQWFYI